MSTAFPRHRTLRTITDQLAEGKTLSRICEQHGMPSLTTVMRWQLGNADLRDQLRRARQMGADAIADECLQIADDATPESARVARLRINTRLRVIGAWAPEQYARNGASPKTQQPVQVVIDFGAMGVRMTDADALPALPAPDSLEVIHEDD